MKDVPVILPKGIVELAVLERAKTADVLVENKNNINSKIIATSSLRRQAQWLNKFPDFTIDEIRGNVNTRLNKVENSEWKGAIFALAGLQRIDLLPENCQVLDWMIPAPAQGAILVVGQENNIEISECVSALNDAETATCVKLERDILRNLEGGCTAPIAALVEKMGTTYKVKAGVYSLNGQTNVEVEEYFPVEKATFIADIVSDLLRKNGGEEILKEIKSFTSSA